MQLSQLEEVSLVRPSKLQLSDYTMKLVEPCRGYMITEWDCETSEGININLIDDKAYEHDCSRVILNPFIKTINKLKANWTVNTFECS
ncbi:MAG: hypothetical protein ACTS6G_05160 [Candidatus Hodgkinia cicadicola]